MINLFSRFFKIFPLLGQHQVGLEKYARYLCTQVCLCIVTSWILRKIGLVGLHVRMNGHCMIIVDQNNRSIELALLLLIKARYPYNKNWYKWNKYNKAKKKHEGDVVSPCLFNLLHLSLSKGNQIFFNFRAFWEPGFLDNQLLNVFDICYRMKSAIIVLMVDPIAEMIYVWCMQLLIKKKMKIYTVSILSM